MGLNDEQRLDAEALFRAHSPFVAAFLQRCGVPASEVEDLVQDVFLVVHRKGGFVPGAAHPRTWLAAIAIRMARKGRQSRARRRESADTETLRAAGSSATGAAEILDVRTSLKRVQRALDTLDMDHRPAFVLYEIEGEPCDSIAAAFGVPIGTVYSRLHYARKRFLAAYQLFEAGDEHLVQPLERT
jgi:RNA polymerase sigma-70 factor (ECF subfamily)